MKLCKTCKNYRSCFYPPPKSLRCYEDGNKAINILDDVVFCAGLIFSVGTLVLIILKII